MPPLPGSWGGLPSVSPSSCCPHAARQPGARPCATLCMPDLSPSRLQGLLLLCQQGLWPEVFLGRSQLLLEDSTETSPGLQKPASFVLQSAFLCIDTICHCSTHPYSTFGTLWRSLLYPVLTNHLKNLALVPASRLCSSIQAVNNTPA